MSGATRVEELDQYGKGIDDMPRRVIARQAVVFLSKLRRRYGLRGLVRIMGSVVGERRRMEKATATPLPRCGETGGPGAVNEALTMSALFNVMTPIEGREGAYEVAKEIFQEIAPVSMKALYQSDDLARCSGDRFENFKTFHMSMFGDCGIASQIVVTAESTVEWVNTLNR